VIHTIEFRQAVVTEVDRPEYRYQQRIVINQGTRLHVQLKPYVAESPKGPVEVADLYFEDGGIAHAVQFAAFRFIEEDKRRSA